MFHVERAIVFLNFIVEQNYSLVGDVPRETFINDTNAKIAQMLSKTTNG